MKLNISLDWLRQMAEKEANSIISVGGLVVQVLKAEAGYGTAHQDTTKKSSHTENQVKDLINESSKV
jgi:hypothetical protein